MSQGRYDKNFQIIPPSPYKVTQLNACRMMLFEHWRNALYFVHLLHTILNSSEWINDMEFLFHENSYSMVNIHLHRIRYVLTKERTRAFGMAGWLASWESIRIGSVCR